MTSNEDQNQKSTWLFLLLSFCDSQMFKQSNVTLFHCLLVIQDMNPPKRWVEKIVSMNISEFPFISFQSIFIVNIFQFTFLSKKDCFTMLFSICFKKETNAESFNWILSCCPTSWVTDWNQFEIFSPFSSRAPWVDAKILFWRFRLLFFWWRRFIVD